MLPGGYDLVSRDAAAAYITLKRYRVFHSPSVGEADIVKRCSASEAPQRASAETRSFANSAAER